MIKGSAALVLAVLIAAIVAGGPVAAQARPGTSLPSPNSLHTGAIPPVPAGQTTTVSDDLANGSAFKDTECAPPPGSSEKEKHVGAQLRLVKGPTDVQDDAPGAGISNDADLRDHLNPPEDVNSDGKIKVHDNGTWRTKLRIPRNAEPGPDTIEVSCDGFNAMPGGSEHHPEYQDGLFRFDVTVCRPLPIGCALTGFAAWPWAILGASLLTVGAVLVGAGRRRTAPESA